MPQRGASGRVRGVSNASEQSEPKVNNKRNPKKSNNKRSLRKRQEQDDEEEKYSDQFKKPTPVKYQKIDEEENDYIKTKDNFKIQLDNINASTGIRRSTRSRIPVIDESKYYY